MKKRMFVGLFMCVACLLHLSVPSVVFGQSLAEQVFNNNKELLQREEIRSSLPDVLRILGEKKISSKGTLDSILANPRFLFVYPEFKDNKKNLEIMGLLVTDVPLRALFRDEQFFRVLTNETENAALVRLIEATPIPAKIIKIISGNGQEGKINTRLPDPFVVEVQDQNGKSLSRRDVTFKITKGKGHLSSTRAKTDTNGRAEVTLRLGSELGIYQVQASVAGLTQTFIAAAIGTTGSESGPAPSLYWVDEAKKAIYHRPTGGVGDEWLKLKNGNLTGGIAVDVVGGRVYWTEKLGRKWRIRSAALDGTAVKPVRNKMDVEPLGIVVGTGGDGKRWVYWTTSGGNIQGIAIKPDGSVASKSFKRNLVPRSKSPMHIAFYDGELYWTESNRIMRANSNEAIVESPDELGGIAVAGSIVYWTEQTSDGKGNVKSVNVNGSGEKMLASLESVPQGLAVDPAGGRLYWTTAGGGIQSTLISPIHIDVKNKDAQATGLALGVPSTDSSPSAAAPSMHVADAAQNNLLANYPNPFNPETWIPYQLSEPAEVTVSIYGVNGSLIRTLALGHQAPGAYRSKSRAAYWDGRNELGEPVASGLYFYTLTAGDFTATRKMLIRK